MNNITSIFNQYYTTENIPFLLLSKNIAFPDNNEDIYSYVYVSENIPWTVMSHKLYGTIQYWWVLSSLNPSSPFYAKKEHNIKYINRSLLENMLKYI